MLRVRAVSSKGASSTGHSSKPSYDEGLGNRSAGSGNGTVGRKTSQVGKRTLGACQEDAVKSDEQCIVAGADCGGSSGSCRYQQCSECAVVCGPPCRALLQLHWSTFGRLGQA
jgi:hypothetical protein